MIPFTQFLLPHGARRRVEIDRPSDIEKLAHELIAVGYCFEIEVLRTGQISMECLKGDSEDFNDSVMAICKNGPEVPECVDRIVKDAHKLFVEGK